jgi:general transcription factor 3C polypeptide 3 (transcription factor C subunit 4)
LWDSCEDDREYDETDWRPGNGRERELAPGKYPLDVNARHRLAVARIKMGDIEEGVVCILSF